MPIRILPKDPIKKEKQLAGRKQYKPTPTEKKKSEPHTKTKKTMKEKMVSAGIEAKIESAKDKVHPLKSDRVTGRGEKKVTFKPGEGASLSTRGTTGTNWRAGKDRVEKWFTSGDAEKNYKKTGKLFTNYSGKMKKGGRAGYNIGGRANLLEEMGRIDARKHPDAADRAEKRRVIGELNKGYKSGGAVLKGKKVGCQIK
jgi:hypothetical protein